MWQEYVLFFIGLVLIVWAVTSSNSTSKVGTSEGQADVDLSSTVARATDAANDCNAAMARNVADYRQRVERPVVVQAETRNEAKTK